MSRRSTRIQQQKDAIPIQTQTSLDEGLVTSDSGEDEAPSTTSRGSQRKKQKTGKEKATSTATGNKRRGTRGILNRLTEISLDVLYEIFGHLEPVDLLHLARTTKSLRSVVLNRSAIGVWKQTLEDMPGLPACPKDLSEPSYASLLFDHYCHTCGTVTSGHKIQWFLRKRFCNKCIASEFVSEEYALLHYDISENRLWSLVPSLYQTGSRSWRRINVFHKPTIRQYEKELKKKSSKTWVKTTKKTFNERTDHGDICDKWLEKRLAARVDEGERIRTRRRDAIIQKLTDLGWGDEIDRLNRNYRKDLTNHPLVRQKRELTDRIWNNIRPELVQVLEKVKADRLVYQEMHKLRLRRPLLNKLRDAYAKTVPPNSIIPPSADLNDYLPFRNIIDNTPSYQDVVLADFDGVLAGLPGFVAQWQKSKERELLQIMGAPVAPDGEDCDLSPLRLATTIFNCRDDHMQCYMVTYPRVLVHDGAIDLPKNDSLDPYTNELHFHLMGSRWNHGGEIQFNTAGHDIAKDIVSRCGLDPLTATAEDMDSLDPVFACEQCNKRGLRRCMRWKETITHALHVASSEVKTVNAAPPQHTFTLITDEAAQVNIKLLLEAKKLARYNLPPPPFGCIDDRFNRFVCTHCRQTNSYKGMKSHMTTHGVTNVTLADLVVDIDIEPQITCMYRFD